MPLRAVIAALVLFVCCGAAAAADVVGYSEAFDTLYRVDLTTRTATEIGRATPIGVSRIANIEGLTFSPAGKLYAASDASSVKSLLQIDPATGLATAIGTLNLGTTQQLDLGMTFTCDGRLWLSSRATHQLWQVNPSNASVTLLGTFNAQITGLAARGNSLYGAASQNDNNLYQVDLTNASSTLIGSYGTSNAITVASPAFDASGKLWSILDYVPPLSGTTIADWSDLATIDAGTGTLTNLGSILPTGAIADPSYQDLFQVGLKGLAIRGAVCASAGNADSTPTLSSWALLALILMVAMIAGTRLTERRLSY